MNMMIGAVAINGGVGVMEVRQPIAKNMAQAAEQMAADLAVNAHITLRELKTKIDTVVEKKLPTFKTLMEKEPVAVAQTMVNGAKLTAYENGYAVYEVDGSHTVMAVDRCNDYRYDFTDGTSERQTEVIQLYFYKGMTLQEIAEDLGITKPAVHYAMKGALKKIRKSF